MADDEKQGKASKGGSPLLRTLMVVTGIVLVSAILAVALYYFVLRGMLTEDGGETPTELVDIIPDSATPFELDSMQAAVLTDDPEVASPILVFQVVLFCSNPETADLISARQQWFETMVSELHRNRTLTEVRDRYTQDAILKQVTQKANELLKRFSAPEDDRVLESRYKAYSDITP